MNNRNADPYIFFTVCLESSESWLAVLSPQEFHLHVDKSLFFLRMSWFYKTQRPFDLLNQYEIMC